MAAARLISTEIKIFERRVIAFLQIMSWSKGREEGQLRGVWGDLSPQYNKGNMPAARLISTEIIIFGSKTDSFSKDNELE
jgi:hypothetical protein